ncbi:hypothetical protein [Mucilaginibacter segetis]|uniref:Uncharacterized protein n=1 Tax=Mucilaginibacter segetis TaxID=2793071 RepID=A0A934PU52_9SPHI|nr:hypothetical protein [Mucilaginibacter segetis]MBK0379196.1 hypothetical protein [Mucilaginibacter segetis]
MEMNIFRDFDEVRTNELYIIRKGWFRSAYELIDGQFLYGKLSYKGNFKRYAVIETAAGIWTLKQSGWFSRNMDLKVGEEQTVGTVIPELWSRRITLEMNDGFAADFYYKKLFSKACIWANQLYGDMIFIKQKVFSIKQPYIITFDQSLPKNTAVNIPMLTLLGVSLLITRQRHAAAA